MSTHPDEQDEGSRGPGASSPAVPILTYHRVHADDDPTMPDVVPGQYCGHVTLSQFEQQMDYLHHQGYGTLTQDDLSTWLVEGIEPPPKSVAINFDDNRYNVLENALAVLRARGFVATMFVITDLADGQELWENDYPALTWEHLGELVEAGWCIGSHTKTHVTFGSNDRPVRDEAHAIDEIEGSQDVIRRRLGVEVDHFAYPSGTVDETADTLVRQYYKTARVWQDQPQAPPAAGYEYVNVMTDPHLLGCVHMSARMSLEQFRAAVESPNPSPQPEAGFGG